MNKNTHVTDMNGLTKMFDAADRTGENFKNEFEAVASTISNYYRIIYMIEHTDFHNEKDLERFKKFYKKVIL